MLYYDYNTEQKFFQIKKALFGHYFHQKERSFSYVTRYNLHDFVATSFGGNRILSSFSQKNVFNTETNQPQTISNLDRLELETDANSTHSKISYINHFKQKKDEDLLKHSAPRIIPRLHSDIG